MQDGDCFSFQSPANKKRRWGDNKIVRRSALRVITAVKPKLLNTEENHVDYKLTKCLTELTEQLKYRHYWIAAPDSYGKTLMKSVILAGHYNACEITSLKNMDGFIAGSDWVIIDNVYNSPQELQDVMDVLKDSDWVWPNVDRQKYRIINGVNELGLGQLGDAQLIIFSVRPPPKESRIGKFFTVINLKEPPISDEEIVEEELSTTSTPTKQLRKSPMLTDDNNIGASGSSDDS